MLIVETNVVGEHVQSTVVGEGFGDRDALVGERGGRRGVEDVMLGDKMACTGVQRASEEGGHDEVPDGVCAEGTDKDDIEDDLG